MTGHRLAAGARPGAQTLPSWRPGNPVLVHTAFQLVWGRVATSNRRRQDLALTPPLPLHCGIPDGSPLTTRETLRAASRRTRGPPPAPQAPVPPEARRKRCTRGANTWDGGGTGRHLRSTGVITIIVTDGLRHSFGKFRIEVENNLSATGCHRRGNPPSLFFQCPKSTPRPPKNGPNRSSPPFLREIEGKMA